MINPCGHFPNSSQRGSSRLTIFVVAPSIDPTARCHRNGVPVSSRHLDNTRGQPAGCDRLRDLSKVIVSPTEHYRRCDASTCGSSRVGRRQSCRRIAFIAVKGTVPIGVGFQIGCSEYFFLSQGQTIQIYVLCCIQSDRDSYDAFSVDSGRVGRPNAKRKSGFHLGVQPPTITKSQLVACDLNEAVVSRTGPAH